MQELFRWVKASERMPENSTHYPCRVKYEGDDALYHQVVGVSFGMWEIDDEYEFEVVEWLEPLPAPVEQGEMPEISFANWVSEHFRRIYPTQSVYEHKEGECLWHPASPLEYEKRVYRTHELYEIFLTAAQQKGGEG